MRNKTSPYYYVQKTSQDFTLTSLNVFRHVKLWFISYPNVLWVKCKWWTPEPNIRHSTKLQEQSWGYRAQNWFVSKELSGPQDPGRHVSASQNWLSLVRQEKMLWGIRCNLSASQNPIGTLQEMGEAAGDKKHPKRSEVIRECVYTKGLWYWWSSCRSFLRTGVRWGSWEAGGILFYTRSFSVVYTEYGPGLVTRDEHGAVNWGY